MEPKSINSLMECMKNEKGINIGGSTQKQQLRYMGYFHGYKGYRYCNSPSNILKYSDFNELQAVYDFDMNLKAILYPQIMFLETTLKNYVLEVIIDKAGSENFNDIYKSLINDYKSYPVGSVKYKQAIKKRMDLRNKVYSAISREYDKRYIINHYYDKDRPVPIWAIFEIISLGEFGNLISCLDSSVKKKISSEIGLNISYDSDGKLTETIIYIIKDLRNAVAHNNTVFDARFKTGNVSSRISNYISNETNINSITFKTIVDYVILISLMMKLLNCDKKIVLSFIDTFEYYYEELRKKVPTNIFCKIIYTDTRKKVNEIKKIVN